MSSYGLSPNNAGQGTTASGSTVGAGSSDGTQTGSNTSGTTSVSSCAGGVFNWACWGAVAADATFVLIGALVIVLAIAAGVFGDGARKQLIAVTKSSSK